MKPELEQAWKLVESGTDDNCDSAARIALAIVDKTAESASDRAEAMFILGQIARFLQPWRCPDDGIAWFRGALRVMPSHLPSMLALCEIAVRARPVDIATLNDLTPQIESLRTSMTAGHQKQWDEVRHLAGLD